MTACSSSLPLKCLLNICERNFFAIHAVVSWLDLHLVVMLLNSCLLLVEDAIN